MSKHQTVPTILTREQLKDLGGALVQAVPSDLPKDAAQHWIGHKKELARELKKILLSPVAACADRALLSLVAEWDSFYRKPGIYCDFSSVKIPADPGGFSRVSIMSKGMTPEKAYIFCAKHFPCWKYTDEDLDSIVTSDRSAKDAPYAIRIRDRVEADEELKNLSYNDLKAQNITGIILEERLIYELKYFKETGRHLDIHNWTLCSGSLYRDGRVPYVSWDSNYGRLIINWCYPDDAGDFLRARVAVV